MVGGLRGERAGGRGKGGGVEFAGARSAWV